ncbi:MAG: CCA tRNA nucleotidyltransferase [Clostridia bacterium]|nr:CCA tRNA nucleotidyltransferase [Clostridia bacterium]
MTEYKIILPCYIEIIISELEKQGFECYAVGGCVRDGVMNLPLYDYDLTTNASPKQIHEIFEENYKLIDTGIRFGTVTLVAEGHNVEITTFRTESDYTDNRRPEKIEFSSNLKEDLSRRDFTVNALAYSNRTGLIDCFSGIDDINNKIIRCIGNPDDRLTDDALRILRALRFSSKLDFSIEEKTKKSLNKNAPLLSNISTERIYSEINKMLSVKNEKRIKTIFDGNRPVFEVIFPEIAVFSDKSYNNFSASLSRLSGDSVSCLVYIACKLKFSDKRMSDLKYEKSIKKASDTTSQTLEYLKKTKLSDTDFMLASANYGEKAVLYAAKIIDAEAGESKYFGKIKDLLDRECVSLKELAIGGKDLNALGIYGKDVSEILKFLLEAVILKRCRNKPSDLIEYYKSNYKKRS